MKNYLPSQVITAYDAKLQSGIMAAFPTIVEAHNAPNVPTIMDLAQAYDDSVAIRWVQHQLLQVNEFAGVRSKLSDMQLEELSIQICLEHGRLNLFEFILFCARLRSGKYEDFYGSVDPMRILKSLSSFNSERVSEIYKERAIKEKEEQEQEEIEHAKKCVSFEDWYLGLSEEEKAGVVIPYFGQSPKVAETSRKPP